MVMEELRTERSTIQPLLDGRKRFLFVEKCSRHNMTEELLTALENVNTEVR